MSTYAGDPTVVDTMIKVNTRERASSSRSQHQDYGVLPIGRIVRSIIGHGAVVPPVENVRADFGFP